MNHTKTQTAIPVVEGFATGAPSRLSNRSSPADAAFDVIADEVDDDDDDVGGLLAAVDAVVDDVDGVSSSASSLSSSSSAAALPLDRVAPKFNHHHQIKSNQSNQHSSINLTTNLHLWHDDELAVGDCVSLSICVRVQSSNRVAHQQPFVSLLFLLFACLIFCDW